MTRVYELPTETPEVAARVNAAIIGHLSKKWLGDAAKGDTATVHGICNACITREAAFLPWADANGSVYVVLTMGNAPLIVCHKGDYRRFHAERDA